MTSRERWIVYPLLFLTLGITMRDKVVPPERIDADEIRCNRLSVGNVGGPGANGSIQCSKLDAVKVKSSFVDAVKVRSKELATTGKDDKELVWIGQMSNGAGHVEVRGASGKPVVVIGADQEGKRGSVATITGDRRPLVHLGSFQEGGAIRTFDRDKNVAVLGQAGPYFGLFGVMPGRNRPLFLSRPWQTGELPQFRPQPKSSEDAPQGAADE